MSLVPDYDSDASDSEAEAIISVPDPKPTITVKSNATKSGSASLQLISQTLLVFQKSKRMLLYRRRMQLKAQGIDIVILPPPKNRKAPKTAPKVEPIQTKQQQQLPTQIPDTTKSNTDSTTPIPSLFSLTPVKVSSLLPFLQCHHMAHRSLLISLQSQVMQKQYHR